MTEPPADPRPFVESLRVAAPYIHGHRGKTFVLLVGGEAAAEARFPRLIHDVALLHALGVRVVLVHGARPQIERRLREKGLGSVFEADTRVTTREALGPVLEATGAARARFEAHLSTGAANTPMAGARIGVAGGNYVTARPVGVRDGVDFRFTGEVRRVDTEGIRRQLDAGALVLLSPVAFSPTGEAFNLHSHRLAADVAVALGADKLVGLHEGKALGDGRGRPVSHLSPAEADRLLDKRGKRLGADARAHLRCASAAVKGGVSRAHLVERRKDGGLLEELFSREGHGTLVTSETYEDLRPARADDLAPLAALLRPLEDDGVLVRRGRSRLEMELERFTVVERDGLVIGCAALEPFREEAMGELFCVVVHPRYRKTGRSDALLAFLEDKARSLGLERLFVLTTHSAHFFQERGFVPATVRQLPKRRRAGYDRRRRSRVLIKTLVTK